MNRPKSTFFKALLALSILLLMGFISDDIPVDKDDQKKIEKAQKLNQEAQELNDKAGSIYSEIANYDESNPKETAKAEKIKIKALNIQLDALELQKEANFLEYNVLKHVLPDLKQNYQKTNKVSLSLKLMEEEAEELFYKAEKLRNEAYFLDKEERENRYQKLNEAQRFEKEGLEKQKLVLDVFLGNSKEEINDQEIQNTQNSHKVVINDELLKGYLYYMEQEDSKSAVESLKELIYSDSLSSESMRNTLEDYLYTEAPVLVSENAESDSVADIISKVVALQTDESKETKNESLSLEEEKPEKNLIYRIQIAADKKNLSQNVLSKLYGGNKEVKMIKVDGWNKYSIGDFNTYAEAEAYRDELGVKDAFIGGFENGVKVDLLAVEKESKAKESKVKESKENVSKEKPVVSTFSTGTIFKVQIAADKGKLSESILNEMYSGPEKIDLIEEEGWNKYSVGKLSSYEQALSLKNEIKAQGSFIVAYNNGAKVPLYKARKGNVSSAPVSSNKEIVFKVQIAADTKSLSSEDLHKIYSGYKKIQQYEEDAWHKYALGDFKSFDEANKFREESGVKGAFVIAFQGDQKLNVLKAKRMNHCYDPQIIEDWYDDNSVWFKVQIAASSIKLSPQQIKNISCSEQKVYLIKEDEWYKYSVGSFSNYKEALKLKKSIQVDGAFIVVYRNGEKLSIKEVENIK